MAIAVYKYTGKSRWAFLTRTNKHGKYAIQFYPPDDATRRAITATGTRCKPKELDEHGWFFTFTSLQPPVIQYPDGTPEGTIVGDGSTVEITISVEDFMSKEHGKVVRTTLTSVAVLNLVPYEKKEVAQDAPPVN